VANSPPRCICSVAYFISSGTSPRKKKGPEWDGKQLWEVDGCRGAEMETQCGCVLTIVADVYRVVLLRDVDVDLLGPRSVHTTRRKPPAAQQGFHQHARENSHLSLTTGPILLIRSQCGRVLRPRGLHENRALTSGFATGWFASSPVGIGCPAAQVSTSQDLLSLVSNSAGGITGGSCSSHPRRSASPLTMTSAS